LKFISHGHDLGMSFLPLNSRSYARAAGRSRNDASERRGSVLRAQLRQTLTIGLLVLTADWGTKALLLQLSPSSTIPHYTHPHVLALVLVLAATPLVLRMIPTRLMRVALGVCIGGCAGNLLQHGLGMPVTDFIALPHLLADPTCAAGHRCVLVCNVADLALWGSIPLLGLAFLSGVATTRRPACSGATA
jgi:lipoprotein signal peptidase